MLKTTEGVEDTRAKREISGPLCRGKPDANSFGEKRKELFNVTSLQISITQMRYLSTPFILIKVFKTM